MIWWWCYRLCGYADALQPWRPIFGLVNDIYRFFNGLICAAYLRCQENGEERDDNIALFVLYRYYWVAIEVEMNWDVRTEHAIRKLKFYSLEQPYFLLHWENNPPRRTFYCHFTCNLWRPGGGRKLRRDGMVSTQNVPPIHLTTCTFRHILSAAVREFRKTKEGRRQNVNGLPPVFRNQSRVRMFDHSTIYISIKPLIPAPSSEIINEQSPIIIVL